MASEQERLLEEFVITTSDVLFEGIQNNLGVTDGGLASMIWTGHPALAATVDAIRSKVPDFAVTEEQAFGFAMGKLAPQPDTDADSLRATAVEYLGQLGKVVGADLTQDGLVDGYVTMLTGYVASEIELAAEVAPKP